MLGAWLNKVASNSFDYHSNRLKTDFFCSPQTYNLTCTKQQYEFYEEMLINH